MLHICANILAGLLRIGAMHVCIYMWQTTLLLTLNSNEILKEHEHWQSASYFHISCDFYDEMHANFIHETAEAFK